jgi:hypothetical protein
LLTVPRHDDAETPAFYKSSRPVVIHGVTSSVFFVDAVLRIQPMGMEVAGLAIPAHGKAAGATASSRMVPTEAAPRRSAL